MKNYVVNVNEDIKSAYWKFSRYGGITIVCDDANLFLGIIGKRDWYKAIHSINPSECDEIKKVMNKHCTTIGTNDTYAQARSVYAEKNIEYIPVIDDERNILDLFTRKRAFYKHFFDNNDLYRMNYANMIMASAVQARKLGYKSISVIEFGVASGNGLLAMQFHAREISRLTGIEIQVYGFDTGKGLPNYNVNYLDMPFLWKQGLFEMDFTELSIKLDSTKLVVGDIKETLSTFFDEYHPAPIAAISVDVDLYTSCLPILEMIENNNLDKFMPRIYMYFDDVMKGYECLGENVAIKQFNARNDAIQISPEGADGTLFWLHGRNIPHNPADNIKICHLFEHKDYNKFIRDMDGNILLNNNLI